MKYVLPFLLACTMPACAYDERAVQPHWPDTLPRAQATPKRTPQVRGWVRHQPHKPVVRREAVARHDHPEVGNCKGPLDALGNDIRGIDDATTAARRAWMERARWRYGERFMEINYARDTHIQCSRTEAPLTDGKVGKALDDRTHLSRCEIIATPCAAPLTKVDK